LAVYLPGIAALPPTDRDEASFAQSTRQMLDSGDFIRPRSAPSYTKPIGIYWLQAGAVSLTASRDAIWPYRVPSLIGAILAVFGTLGIGRRLFDSETGLLAAALLAASPLLAVEATLATTDAVLLACVVAAQGCLAQIHITQRSGERPSAWIATAFWAAQGFGVLVKGPVAPAVSLLTIGALCLDGGAAPRRWLADLRIGPGLLLFAAIVGPWGIAVAWATNGDFYRVTFAEDILPKLTGGQESHGAPPGYYLVVGLVTFWPGSFVAIPGVVAAIRRRTGFGEMFCLAWLLPTWLLFELVPTKLPHYVLPTFPALALLTAHAVVIAAPELRSRTARVNVRLWAGAGIVLAGVLIAAPVLLGAVPSPLRCIPPAVALFTTALTVRQWLFGNQKRAIVGAIAGSGVLLASTFGYLLPSLGSLWIGKRVLDAIHAIPAEHRPPTGLLAAVGYREPSLVFLLGSELKLLQPAAAARFLDQHKGALILVSDDAQAAFHAEASRLSLVMEEGAELEGWNYSKGRWVRLRPFRRW
jgi:4-amino-4-deoxy-L-arabinose transferase-like glycosyltransferase